MPVAQPTDWSELSRQLSDGVRQLGLSVDRMQSDQLLAYLACLERWNGVHNLSAWKLPSDFLVRHVLDSFTLVAPLRRFSEGRPLRILDAGSGPGFPAAVLAVMQPDWAVSAVDVVAKKVAFVRHAAADARISNLEGVHARLESLHPLQLFDVVVSRAFASLARLAASTRHLLAADGVWVAQKSRTVANEAAELDRGLEVFHVEPVTVPGLAAERNLVWMRRIH